MTIIPLSDFLSDQQFFITEAQKEKIFVYPTDTIYGIGGIVTPTVVEKINTIKQRTAGKHYSIIAPNNEWVEERFELEAVSGCNGFEETWKTLHKKHGALTLLVKLPKTPSFRVGHSLHLLSSNQKIGVRLIDHPFQQFVTALGQPYITTSANISGLPNITTHSDLDPSQLDQIDYFIDDGVLTGGGSRIIDYSTGNIIR